MECKKCGKQLDTTGLISVQDAGYCSIPCAIKDIVLRLEKIEKNK